MHVIDHPPRRVLVAVAGIPAPASTLDSIRARSSAASSRSLEDRIAADFPTIRSAAHSNMAKLWSGNRQLHYEAWIRDRLGVIEVGLHFEADTLTNARLLAAFHASERAIHRALGADVRIEKWDRGWARVWEPIELATARPAVPRAARRPHRRVRHRAGAPPPGGGSVRRRMERAEVASLGRDRVCSAPTCTRR